MIITQPPSAVVGAVGPGYEGYTKYVKPKPKLVSRFQNFKRDPAGRVSRYPSGSAPERDKELKAKWTSVSQIPPATRRKLVNTWIAYARRIAIARLRQIVAARQRSGYQTVGYTGGFGGTIQSNPTGGAGAVSPDILKTFEENMGLKPIGEAPITEAQKRLRKDCDNGYN